MNYNTKEENNMRKESIMIKIKPVVTALSLISFAALMFVEFISYFIGILRFMPNPLGYSKK